MRNFIVLILFSFCVSISGASAQEQPSVSSELKEIRSHSENLDHRLDRLEKMMDDLLWYQKLGDVAHIDKLYMYGPARWKDENTTAMGYGNPIKFWSYTFFPKNLDESKKYPLIVLPHGGVHADFTTYYTHIVRELVTQGYVVVAAEYRGSTGYGKEHYQNIDYGGLEVDDVFASRNYMVENYSFIDKNRVGIMGWSHGGLISLMNIFDHPEAYQVAFAGVPVSDLISRMGYYTDDYRDLYSAKHHIGQTAHENVQEYRRRSPAWNTQKFKNTPLLIHTNTSDDDVNVLEVEHLIKSLKADGKKFDYEIFQAVPGGHSFDRMDTREAKQIRVKIYQHLGKQLNPENAIKSLNDLQKAGYGF